jgi:O-antigen/teichoic acid export membrane protein
MPNLRHALLFASGGRYIVMAITFFSTIIIARLLSPAEFGVSVLGAAVLGIAEAIRELGSISYLVQERELTHHKIRTVFTISLIVTLSITILLWGAAGSLAEFYEAPKLAEYIKVVAFGYAIAPFAHPIYAMLSRDMAFGRIAVLDILTTLVNAVVAVCLVLQGFSYMGLAWAWVISSASWTLLGFYVMRDFSIYRPSLLEWKSVLAFGACGSARAVLYKATESLFYLILGKLLDARAVGLCQRALLLAQFPERVILAGIGAVALPAFSSHVRRGQDLKSAYLNAVEHVSVVLWPALTLLCMLADPIVALLLGPQWQDAVPIMRIFTIALLVNFPSGLNLPILIAAGNNRGTVFLALAQMLVSLAVMSFAARYGLWAVALSTLFTLPFNLGLSVRLVHLVVPFRWRELAEALRKSTISSMLSAVGPTLIMLWYGGGGRDMPIAMVGFAVALCGVGWVGGLWLTRHPLFQELCLACASAVELLTAKSKFLSRISARLRPGV